MAAKNNAIFHVLTIALLPGGFSTRFPPVDHVNDVRDATGRAKLRHHRIVTALDSALVPPL